MDVSWISSLIAELEPIHGDDPVRILLVILIGAAGWMIYRLAVKLDEARTIERALNVELRQTLISLEQRAWKLTAELMRERRGGGQSHGDEADL